jgi:hypothetical protein
MSHFSEQSVGRESVDNKQNQANSLLISYVSSPNSLKLAKLLDYLCDVGEVKNAITLIKNLPEQPLSAIDQNDISILKVDIVASEGENEQKLLVLDNLENAVRTIKKSLK